MLNILVVDDAEDDRLLAERVLRHCKILNPVLLFRGGDECIRHFEENSPKGERSLVFLDMIMAPTSGLNVLRRLRDRNIAGESVLVMLSGITDMKLIQEGYQLGAQTFLVKPFQADDVVDFLNSAKGKIHVEEGPDGNILHWIETPHAQRSGDTEIIRRSGGIVTFSD
jgi:CheY-like chemotaxis protein